METLVSPFVQSPFLKAFRDLEDTDAIVMTNPKTVSVLDFALVFHRLYHNREYQLSKTGFHHKLAQTLTDFIDGKIKRLIISAPPQHGKSQLIKYAMALAIARDPSRRLIYGSYGQSLSDEASLETRDIVYSEAYRQMFGVRPHPSVGTISNWKTEQNGGLRATGVGGGLTGRSGDLVFVDDPHKDRQEANSEVARNGVKSWWKSTLTTRFQGDATGVCIVMTRWQEDDLAGWLTELDNSLDESLREGWVVINFPALAEEEDLLGRQVGESLYPEKYSANYLLKKQATDPLEFEALFQGHPTMQGGDLFFRDDFVEYESYADVPIGLCYASFDTAMKDKESNDLSAWVKAVVDTNQELWLVDFGWGKLKSPQLRSLVEAVYDGEGYPSERIRVDMVLIEDKASGIGLIQEFDLSNPLNVPVRGVNPGSQDKVLRTVLLQGKVRTHKVHVPKNHPRLEAFLAFFSAFPNGRYLDPVDALTQLVNFALYQRLSQKSKRGSSTFSYVN